MGPKYNIVYGFMSGSTSETLRTKLENLKINGAAYNCGKPATTAQHNLDYVWVQWPHSGDSNQIASVRKLFEFAYRECVVKEGNLKMYEEQCYNWSQKSGGVKWNDSKYKFKYLTPPPQLKRSRQVQRPARTGKGQQPPNAPETRPSSSHSWALSIRRSSSPLASPSGSRQSLASFSQGPATRPTSSNSLAPSIRQVPGQSFSLVSPVSSHPSAVSLSRLSSVSSFPGSPRTSTPPQPIQHPAPPKPTRKPVQYTAPPNTTKPPSGLSGWFRGRKSKK